jgi:hypothetical protein
MDRPRCTDRRLISRSGLTTAKVGERFRSQQPYRHTVAAQGPERRGRAARSVSKSRGRGHAVSQRNTRSGVGVVPRLCCVVYRSRATTRLRCTNCLRLPPRSKPPPPWFGRKRLDPRLGRGVRIGRRLDNLRPNQPQRRRSRSNPRRGCPRYQPVHARVRQLLRTER